MFFRQNKGFLTENGAKIHQRSKNQLLVEAEL